MLDILAILSLTLSGDAGHPKIYTDTFAAIGFLSSPSSFPLSSSASASMALRLLYLSSLQDQRTTTVTTARDSNFLLALLHSFIVYTNSLFHPIHRVQTPIPETLLNPSTRTSMTLIRVTHEIAKSKIKKRIGALIATAIKTSCRISRQDVTIDAPRERACISHRHPGTGGRR
jgi:hypothetical protein